MACRGARSANKVLRSSQSKSSASCFELQYRQFTSSRTSQKSKAVPSFNEASNLELQDLLSTIRNNLFLPAYLSKADRKIIFSTKQKRALEDDPLNVEISGEKFRLRHLSHTKDMPRGPLPQRVLGLMETRQDWNNLPALLEGLEQARKLQLQVSQQKPLSAMFQIIRQASIADRQDVLLECARRASETGFYLKDFKIVREIMWWIQYKALSSDLGLSQTRKAFKMAEQLASLLEEDKHAGGNRISGESDPRARPEIIGVLLELSAVQFKISGIEENRLAVEKYAKRLLAVMANSPNSPNNIDDQSYDMSDFHTTNDALRFSSTLLYGLREASEVLGSASDLSRLLSERAAEVAEVVQVAADLLAEQETAQDAGGKMTLGRWTHNKLFPLGIKALP